MGIIGLDPEFGEMMAARRGLPVLTESTLSEWRAAFPPPVTQALSDRVERYDRSLGPGGPVIRVHRPRDAAAKLPCLYWMHAGGLVLGNRFQDDVRFDVWCQRHQMVAVSIEYRLAPESRYPAALQDCYEGLIWLRDNCSTVGADPDRIGVGGASAGGGLAAAVALFARDHGVRPPAFQLLVYPMLDDRQQTLSSRANVPVWPPAANAFGWRSYLGGGVGSPSVDCYAAPARTTDLSGLPPAYVVVGGLDGFLDEDIDYATRLLDAGVPADLRVYPGLPHGFDGSGPDAAGTKRAQRDLHDWLGRALRPGRTYLPDGMAESLIADWPDRLGPVASQREGYVDVAAQ
jgi:acetyl esterase/lipase